MSNFGLPDIGPFASMPKIELPPNPIEVFYAKALYHRIVKQVRAAEEALKEGEQLAAFYYPAAGELILIADIGYHNPTLIVIYGQDPQGLRCRALVHVGAFQMVMKVRPAGSAQPPRRQIGFSGEVAAPDRAGEPSSENQPAEPGDADGTENA